MTKTLADFVEGTSKLPGALRKAQVRGVERGALAATREIRTQIRTATGGDMRLSGVGKNGAKVGARYQIYKSSANPTAVITATGRAFPIIERSTQSHTIIPRGRRVSKRWENAVRKGKLPADSKKIYLGGAKALKFGGKFYSGAEHPGTRGKRPFRNGWNKSIPETRRIFGDEISKAIKGAF